MADYHHIGNMEGPLGNATSTTSWHDLHWWKSPRWVVIRIETLAVVAIIFSFFLAVFGSCRRWSNSWIVQKGFFAAQVLSLSLGTYSIGLMQSSSVKSEMYPIWTVSLFTLFGCIDPVTTYNGLDYKGPLSKVVFGICLNCGYVLLMSISTISNVVGNAAIITLSAITFVKGFHRSFALVHQNRMRDMVNTIQHVSHGEPHIFRNTVLHCMTADLDTGIILSHIEGSTRFNKDKWLRSGYDVCVALYLSGKLQSYFLGLDYHVRRPETLKGIDLKWALKVIEIELAFIYDAFFTGNPFLHYYQVKTASLWALASFSGICFVLVTTAIPGIMTPRRSGTSGCTKVVGTTTADLAITFGILVSLALLQLMQLVQSWTSNWARAAVCSAYGRKKAEEFSRAMEGDSRRTCMLSGWLRLKVFVATSTNLFDKYLWQDKINQYSMLPEPRLLDGRERKGEGISSSSTLGERCVDLVQMLGLDYILEVIWELLSSDTNKRGGVKLDEDVKGSVIEFLGQIQSDRLDRNWLSSLPEEAEIRHFLPHFSGPRLLKQDQDCYRYTSCVMTWHIVTWYCELAELKRQEDAMMNKAEAPCCGCGREIAVSYYLRKAAAAIPQPGNYFQRRRKGGGGGGTKTRDHRRVANALSMYCVYLVSSAPELLPGPVARTKRVYDRFAEGTKESRIQACDKDTILANMSDRIFCTDWYEKDDNYVPYYLTGNGEALAKLLMRRPDEIWKTLALVWVQLLVYAAPYGNAEAHMRHLSQGGEFITHLWALLYHLDIREWKLPEVHNLHNIATIMDAERILALDDIAVVAFLSSVWEPPSAELATASKLEDGVRFYLTSSPDVARHFHIGPEVGVPALVLLNKEAKEKFTLYDGSFRAYDIAYFVTSNKRALAKTRAQGTARSSVDNTIKKQSSEDRGQRQTEDEIGKESSGDRGHGQTKDEIEEEMSPLS